MSHSKPIILIADDEADCADVLGLFIQMHFPEATVSVTYGGRAALEQARRQRPDAAVLDMEMPGMDGEALARALRDLYSAPTPLLIVLSGNVVRLEQVRGNGAFDQHLSKPTDVDALTRILGEWFSRLDAGTGSTP